MKTNSYKHWLLFALLLLLAACASTPQPDLGRLYEDVAEDAKQPPLIIIHGLMGSTLVDKQSGVELWPGPLRNLALSQYRELSRLPVPDSDAKPRADAQPGGLITDIAGTDFYGALLNTLETVGRYTRSRPGEVVNGDDRRRYYVFLYDWRDSNTITASKLHAFIEQIRKDYADPALRFDIIAHSNGGLVASYYLRYGPRDVLDEPTLLPWNEGEQRVRRLVLLGTPNLGAVQSIQRLMSGFRITVRTVPVEVIASFSTVYETLPHPASKTIVDNSGQPATLDWFDPQQWRANQWGVYSPEIVERVYKEGSNAESSAKTVVLLQQTFERELRRAKRFHESLGVDFPSKRIRIAAFGGDCDPTLARGILENIDNKLQLRFAAGDIKNKISGVDYQRLLTAPGDGLVTRASQESTGIESIPIRQSFFLCEKHESLVRNSYFQNNLLNFLLR